MIFSPLDVLLTGLRHALTDGRLAAETGNVVFVYDAGVWDWDFRRSGFRFNPEPDTV